MQGRESASQQQPAHKKDKASSLPAAVPVVGRPEEQRLAARAAVGRRVTAVHRRRHRVLLVPCGESGTELTPGAQRGSPAPGSSGSVPELLGSQKLPREGCWLMGSSCLKE